MISLANSIGPRQIYRGGGTARRRDASERGAGDDTIWTRPAPPPPQTSLSTWQQLDPAPLVQCSPAQEGRQPHGPSPALAEGPGDTGVAREEGERQSVVLV